jgi:hypothetical protein
LLLQEAAVLARKFGPPESFTAALGLIERMGVIGLRGFGENWAEQGLTYTALPPLTAEDRPPD